MSKVEMRIGIHTGDTVTGIVGKKMQKYDLFGLAPSFANKVEQNGIPGKVVISQATLDILING